MAKLREEEKAKMIDKLEKAIKVLERLSTSVGERAKEIENIN